MEILKKCPLCGGEVKLIEVEEELHDGSCYKRLEIECEKCQLKLYGNDKIAKFRITEKEKEDFINLWNTRYNHREAVGCKGCINIAFRYPYASMFPCNSCVRANAKDFYVPNIKEGENNE